MVGFGGVVHMVKGSVLVAESPPTVTCTRPLPPAGTIAVMFVGVLADTTAFTPLKVTVLFPGVALKFVPLIITDAPTGPIVWSRAVTVGLGAETTVNVSSALIVPPNALPRKSA